MKIETELAESMAKINSRGKYCTFSVKSSDGVLKYESYIATGNENGYSHMTHDNYKQVLSRFNNYLKDSKGECIDRLKLELKEIKEMEHNIHEKLIVLIDWKVGEANES